jgi:hypothetical protein
VPALPEGLAWVGRAELAAAGGGRDDATLAERALEELAAGGAVQPWAARGWFAAAEAWLRAAMEAAGRPLTGPLRQVRVWELSSVLRAPTGAGDVWFKANLASPLFVDEGAVMGTLAALFPGRVPAPLAVDAERGWMVLDDFGEEVGWGAPVEVAVEVARAHARLQVEAAAHVDRLLAAGCHDRRLDRLAAEAEAWLPALAATGRLPCIDAATWLSEDEQAALRAAVPRLLAHCDQLAGYAVPPSIVHGDLHLGNVARGPDGYLLFDWTDACVAHPFLDLPSIRRGTAFAEDEGETELRERLRAAYIPEWASFESPARLGAGAAAGRPPPRDQLPVDRRPAPAADRPPHGPVDGLVAAPGPGRPGVTDGTRARCRTAQPGRRRRRRLTAEAPLKGGGRWSWRPRRPRCRS